MKADEEVFMELLLQIGLAMDGVSEQWRKPSESRSRQRKWKQPNP
jgi:hypothetical protein